MATELYVFADAGSLFEEWTGKVHVFDWKAGRLLCGRHLTGSCLSEVDPRWLSGAEGSPGVCKQCREKARKMLIVDGALSKEQSKELTLLTPPATEM